jgi:Mg/Co/Ni transporter MgtE
VVDEAQEILGIVTVDDAIEVLLPKDWRQRLPRLLG